MIDDGTRSLLLTDTAGATHDVASRRRKMGARVLVIDDSPTIRRLVSAILDRHGYQPLTAADGPTALDYLKQVRADLLLVDFVMPRMNGLQLCQELRKNEATRAIPVVLMSASESARSQAASEPAIVDAISKPFEARGLIAVVENALKKRTAAAAGEARHKRPAIEEIIADEDVLDVIEALDALEDGQGIPSSAKGKNREPEHVTEEALAGDISVIPFAEILQVLQLQQQTGICRISNGAVEIAIWVRAGLIDLAQGRGTAGEFRLGRYLIEEGLVTREDLAGLVRSHASQGRVLGEILLERQLVTDEDLRRALMRQTSELIYEVLRWPKGRFVFSRRPLEGKAAQARLGLPVASIVMEGFRRVDEWRLMEESIHFDEVLLRDEVAVDALGDNQLTRQEQLVLSAIDGRRAVRDIISEAAVGSFDACKILYQFLQSRLVRRRAA
jgi:CheY-like chemotaxis protein